MNNSGFKTLIKFLPLLIVTVILIITTIVLCIIMGGINSTEIRREEERKELLTAKEIPNGVTINGIDVGGMDYNEAVLTLKAAEQKISDSIAFNLVYEDKEYMLDSDCFDITYNTEEVVRKALGMITECGYIELKQYIDNVKKNGVDYDLEYNIDSSLLDEHLEEICNDIYIAPVNAQAKIKDNFKTDYSTVINGNPFTFEKPIEGLSVDKDALVQTLTERIESRNFGEVEIPVQTVEPEISLEDLKENTVLRAYFSTSYSKGNSENRVHNIKTAAGYLNTTCVHPGDTFSMEGTIGRRVDPKIWKMAPAVIAGGAATENQLGGGVCQVSTTLYNAVVKSDLQIVFRKNHSSASSYVDPGLDATINTDTIDFKWKNNTDYDVYVFSWVDSSRETIYCAVYGQAFPSKFNRIEFKSTLKNKIEPTATEYIKNSALAPGEWCVKNEAKTGYVYESYIYYYKGSKLVDTKYRDSSTYKMHPKRIYVWSGYTSGAALSPSLEMVLNSDGSFSRRYKPQPVVPTPTPDPVQPTSAPDPNNP